MTPGPENHPEQKKLILAGCMIIREGKILLLHRKKPDQWELPGGKVDEGEAPSETAKRELKEEIGCEVLVKRHFGTKDFVEDGIPMQYEWFTADLPYDQSPSIGEPHKFDGLEWISISELRSRNLSPNMKKLVEILRS